MDQLKEFFEAIALIANTSTVLVNFKDLKIRFPVMSVKKALDSTSEIENILTLLFDRKQVTWESYNYEDIHWSQNSLKDLRNKCDDQVEILLKMKSQNQDQFHFLASFLRIYGSLADEAYKEIVKSDMTDKPLDKILKNFRKNAYPIIVTFIFSLPDLSPIKSKSFDKLEQGLKNSKLRLNQIIPKWSIEPQ